MCGIAGFVGANQGNSGQFAARVGTMTSALVHRGPDDAGAWVDVEAGVALGHRRLSIIDLSAQGHQPMESAGGRFVITFNGEIYNFQAIRRQLDEAAAGALRWRGHSDTEVMLAAFEAWGVEGALQRLNGMFAFALWDRKERRLHLARDRMGEKPVYYGWSKGTFLFGSELKALRAHPAFDARIDRGAITLLLRYGCIPAPYSIYQGVKKLTPGTLATLTLPQIRAGEEPSLSRYWSLRDVAGQGVALRATLSDAEAVGQLDALLRNAVAQQMVADVPLGAFLSGGVDSSAIVALMQAQSARPVKTFTIGFSEEGFNEAVHARAVARHLGTDHSELYVTPAQARAVIPRLSMLYDEPFSDSSQIPTFLVAQLARQHVTVALSGDAGDELFGGYNRYLLAGTIWRMMGWLSPGLRRTIAGGLMALSPATLNRVHGVVSALLPRRLRVALPGDKAHKLSEILAAGSPEAIYRDLVSHWKAPADIVIGATEPPTVLTEQAAWPALRDFEQRMMYLDAVSYLPDDILVKVDRAAMGVSLETRVPFLDHRVVEFAWRLPLSMKIRNGQGKWILRQVLNKYVPNKLIERPKMGFGVPIDAWLRGPLREWAESLLEETRLRREGFFHPAPIRNKWREHLSGERNWQYYLWDVLMFQAWHEHWIGP